ncbi:MAG: NADH-quinone oxidoreductase subunit E [Paracoccaceae bacterium]|jgi:NADH-quinone oxidoreductase subunit E
MLRRLHKDQPDSFAFMPANQVWAEAQITKYPEGRQASAIIPLLWRAQEQEGWLTRPAIEHIATMLDLAYIRALEVATFYFMFQLAPVGAVAHIQVCGTTSCMICGAEDLISVCQDKISKRPHQISDDGKFSWEEVECLGSCSNAPMAQIGKDYYEDLTAAILSQLIDDLAAGKVPTPGPQNGRYASEPLGGLTSLKEYEAGRDPLNVSARLATDIGDTVKRIDGTEVPMIANWGRQSGGDLAEIPVASKPKPKAKAVAIPKPASATVAPVAPAAAAETQPARLADARDGKADDLKKIKGIGPKLEALLHTLGFYHFDQVAAWSGAEVDWVDQNLAGFKGSVSRDGWVEQAKKLVT